jgi:hypothetical protein
MIIKREGDLIQIEKEGDPYWDHSMIIVRTEDYGYEVWHWVAGHSPDVDNYPLDSFDYADIRFIHIDRIDGYAKIYIPLVIKGADSEGEPMQNPLMDPYPAPMESGNLVVPSPYPLPSGPTNQSQEPYPAP